jgi:sortase (surface protein transpeptidase)
MILSGHQNTKGEVFRLLSEIGQPGNALGVGDSIIVVAEDGQEYTYELARWDRFQEEGADPEQVREHARYLAPTQTATLTLVTCWPYEGNSHRVIVVAELRP